MGFAFRDDDPHLTAAHDSRQGRAVGGTPPEGQQSNGPAKGSLAPNTADAVSGQEGRGASVVLVEDDPAVRQVAAMILDFLGYHVIEFDNASSALTFLAQDGAVALLFTDIRLPGEMRGTELALEARRLRPDLSILLTTGNVSDISPHVMRRLPGTEILLKPYGRSRLQRMVASAIARTRPAD